MFHVLCYNWLSETGFHFAFFHFITIIAKQTIKAADKRCPMKISY